MSKIEWNASSPKNQLQQVSLPDNHVTFCPATLSISIWEYQMCHLKWLELDYISHCFLQQQQKGKSFYLPFLYHRGHIYSSSVPSYKRYQLSTIFLTATIGILDCITLSINWPALSLCIRIWYKPCHCSNNP